MSNCLKIVDGWVRVPGVHRLMLSRRWYETQFLRRITQEHKGIVRLRNLPRIKHNRIRVRPREVIDILRQPLAVSRD